MFFSQLSHTNTDRYETPCPPYSSTEGKQHVNLILENHLYLALTQCLSYSRMTSNQFKSVMNFDLDFLDCFERKN